MTDSSKDIIDAFSECADTLLQLTQVQRLRVMKALIVFFSDPALPPTPKEPTPCPTTDSPPLSQ